MAPTPGTLPFYSPYQPGALPFTGEELLYLVNTENWTAAASFRVLVTDVVGKAASVLPQVNPSANDIITIFQASSDTPKSISLGSLPIVQGNVSVGGTVGQLYSKNSGTDFDASWTTIVPALTITNLTVSSGTVTNLTVTTETATNLTVGNVTATNLTVTAATAGTLFVTTGTATNLMATNLKATNLTATAATIATLAITNPVTALTVTNLTVSNLTATAATATNLFVTTGTVTGLAATNLTVTSETATNLTVTNITATSGTATNLTATNLTFGTGTATGLTVTNLTATNLTVGASGTVAGNFNVIGTATMGLLNTGGFSRVTSNFGLQSSTTLINITGLSAALAATTAYFFRCYLYVTAGSTGGTKIAINATQAINSIIYDGFFLPAAGTTANTFGGGRAVALGAELSATSATTPTCQIFGTVVTNSSCTLTAQIAQVAATTTTTLALAGSLFEVFRVT